MATVRGDSPQLALDKLDPSRITFARELRGLTKKQLAQNIKKTPSAISQIERGLIRPDLETFISISFTLQVPTYFFMDRNSIEKSIDLASCHFRSLRSTSQSLRRQSARKGDLCVDLIDILESKGVIFPQDKIAGFSAPSDSNEQIEQAASDLRRHWDLGYGPISNMVRLVESKGIMVLPLPDGCTKVDAYSTWRGRRPCMLLSFLKTASRVRFDVAHELGHFALHEDTSTGETKTEREADRFAGAFLAPRESFLQECPRGWSLEAFRQLKFRWKISISALLYRAKDLGCISVSTHRRAMIQLSQNNMRKNEGPEWDMEKPVLVAQALEVLSDRITLDELASELSVYPHELRDMLTQCVPTETIDKINRKVDTDPTNIVKLRR